MIILPSGVVSKKLVVARNMHPSNPLCIFADAFKQPIERVYAFITTAKAV